MHDDGLADAGEDWWPPFPDWSDIEYFDGGPVDLPYVAQCGNGVLDPGEECDDSNRVNGDGCDWLCRLGDGDPPPPPDRDAGAYEPGDASEEPVESVEAPDYMTMDLTWAATAFAVALCEDLDPSSPDAGPWAFRFARFDRAGERVGPSWSYPAPSSSVVRLVWTGEGFGLFFVHPGAGLVLLRLDPDGKPFWPPLLLVPDPNVVGFDADWAAGQFVVAWTSAVGAAAMPCDSTGPKPLRVALFQPDGEPGVPPEPVAIDDSAGALVRVAAGADGLGVAMMGRGREDRTHRECPARFVWVAPDLSAFRSAGNLTEYGTIHDLDWDGEAYLAAWGQDFPVGGPAGATARWPCVGRISSAGELVAAPVCSDVRSFGLPGGIATVQLATGDGGVGLAFMGLAAPPGSEQRLQFLRTDRFGVAVAGPIDLLPAPAGIAPSFGIEYAESLFGVVYSPDWTTLRLRTLVRAGL